MRGGARRVVVRWGKGSTISTVLLGLKAFVAGAFFGEAATRVGVGTENKLAADRGPWHAPHVFRACAFSSVHTEQAHSSSLEFGTVLSGDVVRLCEDANWREGLAGLFSVAFGNNNADEEG